jgi:putative tryptophan/tyrosine transport system substrate-binding protein
MRRRDIIAGLAGAASWSLTARAQTSGRIYRIGFLIPAARDTPAIAAFFDELQLNGFVEGQNLAVLPNGFKIRREDIETAAATLLAAKPDVLVGGPDLYTHALQRLTPTIPIMTMSEDMLAEGLVRSLARPEGNTTGISILSTELNGKRQDLLIEATPNARKIAALNDATVPRSEQIRVLKAAANKRGIELAVFDVSKPEDIGPAVDGAKEAGAKALNFLASSLFFPMAPAALEHINRARLPAIFHWPELAERGGLLGYGTRFTEVFRQRARQTAKVLRGAKPADIPVEQPTRFELVINLQTAKAIGHEIPAGLVLRADKLIE